MIRSLVEDYVRWVLRYGLQMVGKLPKGMDILDKHSALMSYWAFKR